MLYYLVHFLAGNPKHWSSRGIWTAESDTSSFSETSWLPQPGFFKARWGRAEDIWDFPLPIKGSSYWFSCFTQIPPWESHVLLGDIDLKQSQLIEFKTSLHISSVSFSCLNSNTPSYFSPSPTHFTWSCNSIMVPIWDIELQTNLSKVSHPVIYQILPKGFAPASYLSSTITILKSVRPSLEPDWIQCLQQSFLVRFKDIPMSLWLRPCGGSSKGIRSHIQLCRSL